MAGEVISGYLPPGAPPPGDPSVEAYYRQFRGARGEAVLRVLTSMIWLTDPDGRFVSPQVLWARYTGQSWKEQRGYGWLDALHEEDRPRMQAAIEVARRERRFIFLEKRVWHAQSQRYRYHEARGVPIFSRRGELLEWVGTCLDVDDQKQAEEALRRADRRKDEFIAILAHELRNPLAPIRNAAHILNARIDSDPRLAWVQDVIERQVKHMSRLLDDLLDISRIDQDKVELHTARVALDSVLAAAVELSRPLFEEKGHHLEWEPVSGGVDVDADAQRLSQVFCNILNNAAKFTAVGERISLSVRTEAGFAVVTIKDNGIGLAPDMLARVFDLFTQASAAPERSDGGLGIGLALARRVTEMHGGTIRARSAGPGAGTEFEVRIPLAVSQNADEAAAPLVPTSHVRLHIVVADDNRDACETLAALLEFMGHEVRVAFDGQQALDEFRSAEPDVAFLDIGMPRLTGLDLARTLRAEGCHSYLVATTGWGQPEDVRRSIEAGFDRHCVKPVSPAELGNILASFDRDDGLRSAARAQLAPGHELPGAGSDPSR